MTAAACTMEQTNVSPSKTRRLIWVLAGCTVLVLAASIPISLRYAHEHGGFYLFSSAFLEDIPKRLTGPGKFRFFFQPLIAAILGIRSGLVDVRAGRPAYVYAMLFHRDLRQGMLKDGMLTIVNLVLMGILLDSICQWLILGISYPGAALVIGPTLISVPYAISRAITNRLARSRNSVR
jgi:hypothetical protein